jgi:hypothetical protein
MNFFFHPMTQYGDNEIENLQVDNDEPDDVEEDGDVHELNVIETLEQDHFNISCSDNPLEYWLTNFCDFFFFFLGLYNWIGGEHLETVRTATS